VEGEGGLPRRFRPVDLDDAPAGNAADSEREVAPLRPAPDALVVRTDDLDLEDVVRLIVDRIRPAQR